MWRVYKLQRIAAAKGRYSSPTYPYATLRLCVIVIVATNCTCASSHIVDRTGGSQTKTRTEYLSAAPSPPDHDALRKAALSEFQRYWHESSDQSKQFHFYDPEPCDYNVFYDVIDDSTMVFRFVPRETGLNGTVRIFVSRKDGRVLGTKVN
jgi:hypothetical protein